MRFGVCTRVRDEQNILEEWVQHYLALGFSRAVIYDDQSNPPVSDTLRAYRHDVRVTVVSAPTENQAHAYREGLRLCAADCDWVLLCDADEFLWTEEKGVAEFLATFGPEVGTVLVNWLVYGTSWITRMDPYRPVREQFVLRERYTSQWNRWVKSFVRPQLADLNVWVHVSASPSHSIRLATGEEVSSQARSAPANQSGLPHPVLFSERVYGLDVSRAPVLLVHYMTRDFETMAMKSHRNKNLQDIKSRYTMKWYEAFFEEAEFDDRMHKYLPSPKK